MNPSGGAGASNAMHDAIALANRINGLPFHPAADEIEAAFMEYQNERIEWVNAAFENSKLMRNMVGQVTTGMLSSHILFCRCCFRHCSHANDEGHPLAPFIIIIIIIFFRRVCKNDSPCLQKSRGPSSNDSLHGSCGKWRASNTAIALRSRSCL